NALGPTLRNSERSQGDSKSARCTPPARALDLRARVPTSFARTSEGVQGECGAGLPGHVRRVANVEALENRPCGDEVGQRLLSPMLCESQPPARIKEEGEVRARQVGCDRTEARERLVGILEPAAVDGERDRERPRIENVVRETMSSSKLEGLRDVA